MLVSRARGGTEPDIEYKALRADLLGNPEIASLLPRFLQSCRNLSQFWAFIQPKGGYQDRQKYIWEQFAPAFEKLEGRGVAPSDRSIEEALRELDVDAAHAIWRRALERRGNDPAAAITSARTLLETVCKLILDSDRVPYGDAADLPQLYRTVAKRLTLAPDQQTEAIFRQVFGGCQTVVEGLGAARNRLSDAHGRSPGAVPPGPRHAHLAVNLAGAMATFLIETWQEQHPRT